MSASIVIVADDLTGAADCGIACTASELNTVVVFGEISRALDLAADAIAFDADTRRQSPEVACAATEHAVRQLCPNGGVQVLYKKIDSTLRGNFAVEIAAARRASAGLLTRDRGSDSTGVSSRRYVAMRPINTWLALTRAGIAQPRIGVCGINPHAGEHGLFGHGEEESKIEPAVRACQARGWDVQGGYTLFLRRPHCSGSAQCTPSTCRAALGRAAMTNGQLSRDLSGAAAKPLNVSQLGCF